MLKASTLLAFPLEGPHSVPPSLSSFTDSSFPSELSQEIDQRLCEEANIPTGELFRVMLIIGTSCGVFVLCVESSLHALVSELQEVQARLKGNGINDLPFIDLSV